MGSSRSLQLTRDASISQSQINVIEESAVPSQSAVDSASSSQSLSSARKRHFREIDQRNPYNSHNYEEDSVAEDDHDDGSRNQKRSRPSPRTSDVSLQEFGSLPDSHRHHKRSVSSASDRTHLHSRRSSRFTEGSMRDRASQCPPDDFTRDCSGSRRSMSEQRERTSEDTHVSYDAGIKVVRPLGLRRLGKTLATTKKPASVFHGSSEQLKDRVDPRTSQEQQVLEDRRLRAEAAYAQLKKNNYPGTLRTPTHSSHASTSRINSGAESTTYQALLKRNSYADRMEDSEVRGSNRNRPIVHTVQSQRDLSSPSPDLSIAPTIETAIQEAQVLNPPALEPPLVGLKKVKSFFRFPSAKSRSLSPSRAPYPMPDQCATPSFAIQLKESPSKKDLKKQKKLLNKISNLEDKLEHAKRNLRMSLDEAPPIPNVPAGYIAKTENPSARKESAIHDPVPTGKPSKFVPGSLPSLPSERLFNPQDRAVHEEWLRKKNSFVKEDVVKRQFRKNLAKDSSELQIEGSDSGNYWHPPRSTSLRGAPSDQMEVTNLNLKTSTMHASKMEQSSEHERINHAYQGARENGPSSFNSFAGEQEPISRESRLHKNDDQLQMKSKAQEDLKDRFTLASGLMSHMPSAKRRHQRSCSKTLSEITIENLNQAYNQGTHLRCGDQGNRVLTLSPQKHDGIPPVPKVPKEMQKLDGDVPGGKENCRKDTRLSGVREEEEFSWDEDVF